MGKDMHKWCDGIFEFIMGIFTIISVLYCMLCGYFALGYSSDPLQCIAMGSSNERVVLTGSPEAI